MVEDFIFQKNCILKIFYKKISITSFKALKSVEILRHNPFKIDSVKCLHKAVFDASFLFISCHKLFMDSKKLF